MKKPKISFWDSDYAQEVYVEKLSPKEITEAYNEMIDALLVAKRRMNDEIEKFEAIKGTTLIDFEQYESFVNDIEVINKALIKAGVEL